MRHRLRHGAAGMYADKTMGAIIVTGLAVLRCPGPALAATIGAAALSASALAGGAAAIAVVVGLGAVWVHRGHRSAYPSSADGYAAESVTGKGQP